MTSGVLNSNIRLNKTLPSLQNLSRFAIASVPYIPTRHIISNSFRSFYSSLYNLHLKDPPRTSYSRLNKIKEYIVTSNMPTLDPAIWGDLDAPISQDEIQPAIRSLPSSPLIPAPIPLYCPPFDQSSQLAYTSLPVLRRLLHGPDRGDFLPLQQLQAILPLKHRFKAPRQNPGQPPSTTRYKYN